MKKILLVLIALIIIFIVIVSIFLPSFAKVGIKEINSQTDFSISEENIQSSFPLGVKINNVRFASNKQPLLSAKVNLLEIKPCLFSLLKLNVGGNISGKMYDGEFSIKPFKNLLKNDFNVDFDIKNINLSKYQILLLFPVSGGYISLDGNSKISNNNLTIENGKFSFKDFNIKEEFFLKKEMTTLPLDIKLPKLHIEDISFLYALNENILGLKNFNLSSNILNMKGNCNLNVNTQKLNKCDIEFDFTDEGWQEYSSWIGLLTSNEIKENRKFTVSLKGNVSYPKYEIN